MVLMEGIHVSECRSEVESTEKKDCAQMKIVLVSKSGGKAMCR